MIRRIAAALIFVAGLGTAGTAHATGEIVCTGDGVSVDMLVGRFQFVAILRAVITVGEETWSTDQDFAPGTPIRVAQAFEDQQMLLIDFTDDNYEGVIGRLRAVNLEEISAGAFALEGKGAWIVDCSLRG